MLFGGWKNATKAFLLLCCAAAVIGSFARVIDQPFWLRLYQNHYTFTPGIWFANRLNEAQKEPDKTCLLLGASTVREGMDSSRLEALLPGQRIVNLATTGGISAIDVIEIQARILSTFEDRYACIVVGLHPVFLRQFVPESYDILTTDYAALLPLAAVFNLTRPPWEMNSRLKVLLKYLLPLAQHALVTRRFIRSRLYELHHALINANTPRRAFEEFENELMEGSQYIYHGPSTLKNIEVSYPKLISDYAWDQPSSYASPDEPAALRHALEMLSKLTGRLIVVEMPESFLFEKVDRIARPSYEAALASANVPMTIVRCAVPRSEHYEMFHDAFHLNAKGRALLSESFAPYLLAGDASTHLPAENKICHLRSNR